MMMVNNACRDCGGTQLKKFLDLGAQPPANRLLKEADLNKPEERYPLEVYWCAGCNSAQLIHVVDKRDLFQQDYVYFTAAVPKISAYWQRYAQQIAERFLTDGAKSIVEIGSNDGVLLKFFKDTGHTVLGIDPAANITTVAQSLGVASITDFFSAKLARQVAAEKGRANVVLANNVFAHIDDHQDFCAGVAELLTEDGVLVIEAPYLVDMFEHVTYDTVYHEHLAYLAVRPLQKLFARFNLEIFDVYVSSAFGQSLRLFIGKQGTRPVNAQVQKLTEKELALGLDSLTAYEKLARRVEDSKQQLMALLANLKADGKVIVGYGAAARSSTILNYCGVGPETVSCILDDFPSKQSHFSPGMHIPILARADAAKYKADYYLLFAWNYREQVLDQEKVFREHGGKFIIPVGDTIETIS